MECIGARAWLQHIHTRLVYRKHNLFATALAAIYYDVAVQSRARGLVYQTAKAVGFDCMQVIELLRSSMPPLGNKAMQISGLFPPCAT